MDYYVWFQPAMPVGGPSRRGGHVQKSRPTQNKRARERARQEKQQHQGRAASGGQEPKDRLRLGSAGDEDPDIAGIVPGTPALPVGRR